MKLKTADVTQYVENHIGDFHRKRVDRLQKLKLRDVLRKKNPYLFKAKYLLTSESIVKSLADAFISSQEETIFGNWLEGLVIFVNKKVYGGWKSGVQGIDLEFDRNDARYIVAIKSGPNWGNSSQVKKMKSDFARARRTLRTSSSDIDVRAVNGCCYGKDNRPDKGEYFKYCGQVFWEFISGEEDLYRSIIEPLGHQAKERNDKFLESYARVINKFTREFVDGFCKRDGDIDWDKLVEFNSGK